jgi:hypothetical protein
LSSCGGSCGPRCRQRFGRRDRGCSGRGAIAHLAPPPRQERQLAGWRRPFVTFTSQDRKTPRVGAAWRRGWPPSASPRAIPTHAGPVGPSGSIPPSIRGSARCSTTKPCRSPGGLRWHDAADAWVEGPSVRPFRSPGEVGDEHLVLQPRFRRRASLLVRPQYRRPRKPQHVTSLLHVHFLKGHVPSVPSAEQPALGKRSRKIALGQIAERARPRVQPAPAPDEALRG